MKEEEEGTTDWDRLNFDFSSAHCFERDKSVWEGDGREVCRTVFQFRPPSLWGTTAIVCFYHTIFRHYLAARILPQCRFLSADDVSKKGKKPPTASFKISVDIVLRSKSPFLLPRFLRIFFVQFRSLSINLTHTSITSSFILRSAAHFPCVASNTEHNCLF